MLKMYACSGNGVPKILNPQDLFVVMYVFIGVYQIYGDGHVLPAKRPVLAIEWLVYVNVV